MANQFTIQIAPDFEQRYPKSTSLATECAMNLVFTADLLVKHIAGLVQPYDLSPASGLVLGILADSETPLSPYQIADRLIISRATVTGLVDSLERRKYVRRIPHSSDRRMLLVEITDQGRQVAYEFRKVVHQNQKIWLEILSKEEQEQLLNSLHKLQTTLLDSPS